MNNLLLANGILVDFLANLALMFAHLAHFVSGLDLKLEKKEMELLSVLDQWFCT